MDANAKNIPSQNTSKTPSDETAKPPAPAPLPNSLRAERIFAVIGVIALLAACGMGAYVLGVRGISSVLPGSRPLPGTSSVTSATTAVAPLFSGTLTRLHQNLQLFTLTQDDELNHVQNDFSYYSAGTFTRGALTGYTRIIAIRPAFGPGGPLSFTLATKNFLQFVLDDPDGNTTNYPVTDWQNPYMYLDKAKVTSTAVFDTEQPKELDLDAHFALYQESYPINTVRTNAKDAQGNDVYDLVLESPGSADTKLTSPIPNVSLYAQPIAANNADVSKLTPEEKTKAQLRQRYLLATSEVVAVDSAGLPMRYAMTTKEHIRTYTASQRVYTAAEKQYQEDVKKYQNKEISTYPKSPDYVYPPSLGVLGKEITTPTSVALYTDYQTAIPGACAMSLTTTIVNVSDTDLEQIGTVGAIPLYRLKDTKHPLLTLAYNNKLDYFGAQGMGWDDANKGIPKPTLDEYVQKTPLLFLKDYWGRWVALGEYDIKLPGGCGKPVIYLYPTTPTPVTVTFRTPIRMTTDIPTYAGSWQVLAHPDGTLTNLLPSLTDCAAIDASKRGSEYAAHACATNTYPYLFWAGSVSSAYPAISGGWIVDRSALGGFLDTTLTDMGLNATEKRDFADYWLADMLSKHAPYYRVSFLQTHDVNTLFPMTVSPVPDTVFRIFLDYTPLMAKPAHPLSPQSLDRLVRNGFTLVEWGGLKQP